jgi:hypothetical protein
LIRIKQFQSKSSKVERIKKDIQTKSTPQRPEKEGRRVRNVLDDLSIQKGKPQAKRKRFPLELCGDSRVATFKRFVAYAGRCDAKGGSLSLSCGSHKVEPRASDIPCKRERGGEDYESVSRVKKRVETRESYLGSRQRRPTCRLQIAKLQKFPRWLLYVALAPGHSEE